MLHIPECVLVALVIKHAKRMCQITNYSHVAYLDLPSLPTLSHKQHNFHKIIREHKICVLIFSVTFA